ncbi:hypothetical protein [Actinoplanes sp. NPDC051859]|uniref:hypothetical protein n=1 Tax=Actinoplanes sp. NPDC051859 TaxID=3363909 RepID=UPI00379E8271
MRLGRLAVGVWLLSPLMAAGCGGEGASSGKAVVYTCCKQEDVGKEYRPGETLTLHWTAEEKDGAPASGATDLRARMVGPFDSASAVKEVPVGGSTGSLSLTASPVRIDGGGKTEPVSEIQIPRDATPGYYNLNHISTAGGSSVSGNAVIRIVAAG